MSATEQERLYALHLRLQLNMLDAYIRELPTMIRMAELGDFMPLNRFYIEADRIIHGTISEKDFTTDKFDATSCCEGKVPSAVGTSKRGPNY